VTTIYVKGTRAGVRRAIVKAAQAASGRTQEGSEIAKALQTRMGLTLLAHIRDAFVTKSKGGTDDCGDSWPPLSPKTIAYSRRHPGVPPSKQRSPFRPSWMLTDAQRKKWWEMYRKGLAMFRGDRAKAAKIAWAAAKRSGAKTLVGTYGSTSVLILRDTGLLLNSLSPGVQSEDQVFKVQPGSVIVGTNRKRAGSHHRGVPGRIPQRRLWAPPDRWPDTWWDDINDQARAGYIDVLLFFLRNL
jgi:hypothetical protein